jgi:hypothetical protein
VDFNWETRQEVVEIGMEVEGVEEEARTEARLTCATCYGKLQRVEWKAYVSFMACVDRALTLEYRTPRAHH